ncbi:hypothetical protein GQ600_27346 [Phytophthora cactorum]|nr:hypothetical protein GQ600_27346 [Phytophthora cactorum]
MILLNCAATLYRDDFEGNPLLLAAYGGSLVTRASSFSCLSRTSALNDGSRRVAKRRQRLRQGVPQLVYSTLSGRASRCHEVFQVTEATPSYEQQETTVNGVDGKSHDVLVVILEHRLQTRDELFLEQVSECATVGVVLAEFFQALGHLVPRERRGLRVDFEKQHRQLLRVH